MFRPASPAEGPPVASDVLLLLVGETWSGTQVALKCDARVDGLGDIAVSLGHYDPFLYSSLRLVVMPVLPDKAARLQLRGCPAQLTGLPEVFRFSEILW